MGRKSNKTTGLWGTRTTPTMALSCMRMRDAGLSRWTNDQVRELAAAMRMTTDELCVSAMMVFIGLNGRVYPDWKWVDRCFRNNRWPVVVTGYMKALKDARVRAITTPPHHD